MVYKTQQFSRSSDGMKRDIAHLVLTTLEDAARCSPIPFLQEAATLALGILRIIDDVKSSKEGFVRLAKDSCELVYGIICAQRSNAVISQTLQENLWTLIRTLTSIEEYAKKELKRNLITRVIRHRSDHGKIFEYRETLRQSLDLFGLQSSISIQENISSILQKQDAILRHLPSHESRESSSNGKYVYPTSVGNSRSIPNPAYAKLEVNHGPKYLRIIHGNQITSNMSRHSMNVNSGNVTNTVTTGCNNDTSVRIYGR